jgi:hypothetical protein
VQTIGYQVTGRPSAGEAFTQRVTEPEYADPRTTSFCSPSVRYEIRAVTRNSAGAEQLGQPATTIVDSPIDCTPSVEIDSVLPAGPSAVAVTMTCQGSARGGAGHGDVTIFVDGVGRRDLDRVIDNGAGIVSLSATVDGLRRQPRDLRALCEHEWRQGERARHDVNAACGHRETSRRAPYGAEQRR